MVKDDCKTEYIFAKWMQAGVQHRCLWHITEIIHQEIEQLLVGEKQ